MNTLFISPQESETHFNVVKDTETWRKIILNLRNSPPGVNFLYKLTDVRFGVYVPPPAGSADLPSEGCLWSSARASAAAS